MVKCREKVDILEATQWFKNGDHPAVVMFNDTEQETSIPSCPTCGKQWLEHGITKCFSYKNIVCPGDWILVYPDGHIGFCKQEIFEKRYDLV